MSRKRRNKHIYLRAAIRTITVEFSILKLHENVVLAVVYTDTKHNIRYEDVAYGSAKNYNIFNGTTTVALTHQ